MPRAKQFDETEVLHKAMELFWKKGYHDTSITDLIACLGISNASIYNTFGGKKQLFDRAFQHYRSTSLEGLENFLISQTDVREGLRMIFSRIIAEDLNDADVKGCFVVNSTTELLPQDTQLQTIIAQYKEDMLASFYDFLKKGVEHGQISAEKDIHTISRLLFTLMMGLRVEGKMQANAAESQASIEAVLGLLD